MAIALVILLFKTIVQYKVLLQQTKHEERLRWNIIIPAAFFWYWKRHPARQLKTRRISSI